jgi:ferric-dicitrate binding protein FerR (iron transport regulator)
VRRLWGRDRHGRFRTRGRNGQATVRGTRWLTEDRCDGTLFKVKKGAIDVRARGVHRVVRVRAGHRFLARARRR